MSVGYVDLGDIIKPWVESLDHLFLSCPRSLQVWEAVELHQWIPSDLIVGGIQDIQIFLNGLHSQHSQRLNSIAPFYYVSQLRQKSHIGGEVGGSWAYKR